PEHDPVYKVSIIPRGRALGVTMFLPEEDRYSHSKRHLLSQICSLFGGRIAEQIINGDDGVTTGASNDIQRATELARNMVTKWGLSEKLGPLLYDESQEEVFLGKSAGNAASNVSGNTRNAIDVEVRNIIDECYAKAKQLLEDNRDKLDMMADALMKYETIDAEQINDIMAGKEPREPANWADDDDPGSGLNASADDNSDDRGDTGAADDKDGKTPPIGGPASEH
ncbi:MAG: ATP-dependent metalloprotease, partial [Gammaproteobacteria bacterium]|nr:ATP-dependent metalloprotease [Gammaproteobacteria bacterium]